MSGLFTENLLLGMALTITLGPVTLEILRRGLTRGVGEAIKTATGSFFGELLFFTLVMLGVTRYAQSLIVQIGLGSLGVLFLSYIGYQNIKEFFISSHQEKYRFHDNSFLAGFLILVLNPLNIFMWVGIISVSLAKDNSMMSCIGVLLGIFVSLYFVAFVSKLGTKIINNKRMKYVSLLAGLFLIFYGLKLLHNIFNLFR